MQQTWRWCVSFRGYLILLPVWLHKKESTLLVHCWIPSAWNITGLSRTCVEWMDERKKSQLSVGDSRKSPCISPARWRVSFPCTYNHRTLAGSQCSCPHHGPLGNVLSVPGIKCERPRQGIPALCAPRYLDTSWILQEDGDLPLLTFLWFISAYSLCYNQPQEHCWVLMGAAP